MAIKDIFKKLLLEGKSYGSSDVVMDLADEINYIIENKLNNADTSRFEKELHDIMYKTVDIENIKHSTPEMLKQAIRELKSLKAKIEKDLPKYNKLLKDK